LSSEGCDKSQHQPPSVHLLLSVYHLTSMTAINYPLHRNWLMFLAVIPSTRMLIIQTLVNSDASCHCVASM
jgi:hypothetical protein